MILEIRCESCHEQLSTSSPGKLPTHPNCAHDKVQIKYFSGPRGEFPRGRAAGTPPVTRKKRKFYSEYTGTFKDGLPNDYGVQIVGRLDDENEFPQTTWRIGPGDSYVVTERYKGLFASGARNGKGVLEDFDGRLYVGSFDAGVPNGAGCLTLMDGDELRGRFVDGEAPEPPPAPRYTEREYNSNYWAQVRADLALLRDTNALKNSRVILIECAETRQNDVIRAIRALTEMTLVDAVNFVRAAPCAILECMNRDYAEGFAKVLENHGGKVKVE